MFIAFAPEGWLAKYVWNIKFYNGFRSFDVSFVFRFGGSPSGSPVVENMKSYRFCKLFVDTTGAYFGGSLGHAVAVPGAHFALRNNTNTCKFYQLFQSIFYDLLVVIFGASRSKLFLHRQGEIQGIIRFSGLWYHTLVVYPGTIRWHASYWFY